MTSTERLADGEATVQSVPGGYHLVTYGVWQVTVMNDAMISLPRMVRPEDVDDFCAAMQAAKEVALKQQEENIAAAGSVDAALQRANENRKALEEQTEARRVRRAAVAKSTEQAARSRGNRRAGKQESN